MTNAELLEELASWKPCPIADNIELFLKTYGEAANARLFPPIFEKDIATLGFDHEGRYIEIQFDENSCMITFSEEGPAKPFTATEMARSFKSKDPGALLAIAERTSALIRTLNVPELESCLAEWDAAKS